MQQEAGQQTTKTTTQSKNVESNCSFREVLIIVAIIFLVFFSTKYVILGVTCKDEDILLLKQENESLLQENMFLKNNNTLSLENTLLRQNSETLKSRLIEQQTQYSLLNKSLQECEEKGTLLQANFSRLSAEQKSTLQSNLELKQGKKQDEKQLSDQKNMLKLSEKKIADQEKIVQLYQELDRLYKISSYKLRTDLNDEYGKSNKQYDAVITIDQFKDLTKNKLYFVYKNQEIKATLSGKDKYLSRVVGFLGLRNKGKTYVLNQIIDECLPSSDNVSTKGISFKISQLNKVDTVKTIFMDTEGISKPAEINWKDTTENVNSIESFKVVQGSLTETSLIEKIQQEVIIGFSDVIILVVGYLQHDDQKLIEQTIYQIQNNEKNEIKLFILHNLKDYSDYEQFQEYHDYLQRYFPLEKQVENDMIYFTDQRNKKGKIEHLFFAQKFSEAGNRINDKTLKYLRQKIKGSKKQFNFEEAVKKSVGQTISKYSLIKYNNTIQYNIDLKSFLSLQQVNCTDNNEVLQSINTSINLNSEDPLCTHILVNPNYQIEKAQQLIQDSVGIFHSTISYEIYQIGNNLQIYVDTPGSQGIKKIQILNNHQQKIIVECNRDSLYSEDQCFDEEYQNIYLVSSNLSFSSNQYEIDLPTLQNAYSYYYNFKTATKTHSRVSNGQYLIELAIQEEL